MPLVVPAGPPPKPPTLAGSMQLQTLEGVRGAIRALETWAQALTVYLDRQLTLIREDVNWLVGQQSIRNLVPDSDLKDPASFWLVDPAWTVIAGAGIGGGRGFVLSGSPAGIHDAVSVAVIVSPGAQYVLSGWIDARDLTGGVVSWVLIDALSSAVIAQANATIGQLTRTQVLALIPAGVTVVRIAARADNAVVPAGNVIASEPQLERPIAGQLGQLRPEATLYRTNIGAT